MGHANVIFDTDAFPEDWPDCDSNPPPGKAWLRHWCPNWLKAPECTVQSVDDDNWEHANWFFLLAFGETEYTVFLMCTFEPEQFPRRWQLYFSRRRGLLKTLFTRVPQTMCRQVCRRSFHRPFNVLGMPATLGRVDQDEADKAMGII